MAETFLPAQLERSVVPPHLSINANIGISHLLGSYVASRLLDRTLTVTASFEVPHSFPPASLAPESMTIVHQTNLSSVRVLHLEIPDQADVRITERDGSTGIELAGRSFEVVRDLWDLMRAKIQLKIRGLEFVPTTLWSLPTDQVQGRVSNLPAVAWEECRRNYPISTATTIDRLVRMVTPERAKGRLLLWHGPPGTGKTTAAASLMTAWHPWCDAHVISDPERFFGEPSYLLQVVQRMNAYGFHEPLRTMNEPVPRRWKLIVCEDADEYLRSDAKAHSGPALGRLLNLTDGILGRSSLAIVLLTTNDDVDRLHPAVRRPGRCMAEVSFPAMSRSEAAAWCPSGMQPPESGATLAELFALKDGLSLTADNVETGMYL